MRAREYDNPSVHSDGVRMTSITVRFERSPSVRRLPAIRVVTTVRTKQTRLTAGGSLRPGRRTGGGSGAEVAPDPLLAWLHLEDAEAAQLDPFSAAHRLLHGVENRLHRHHRLDARDIGVSSHVINDIGLDHPPPPEPGCQTTRKLLKL